MVHAALVAHIENAPHITHPHPTRSCALHAAFDALTSRAALLIRPAVGATVLPRCPSRPHTSVRHRPVPRLCPFMPRRPATPFIVLRQLGVAQQRPSPPFQRAIDRAQPRRWRRLLPRPPDSSTVTSSQEECKAVRLLPARRRPFLDDDYEELIVKRDHHLVPLRPDSQIPQLVLQGVRAVGTVRVGGWVVVGWLEAAVAAVVVSSAG